MIQSKNTFNHFCIRCFNITEKEKKYDTQEKTNTLQSNDHGKNKEAA